MKLSLQAPTFSVYDDVVSEAAFQGVWQYVQRENYQWVHAQLWHKAWRLWDGAPMTGPATFSDEATARIANGLPARPQPGEPPAQFPLYPSGRHIDEVIRAVLQQSADWGDLVGTQGRDWMGLTAKPFLYPQGAGQSWQLETLGVTGSYTFFAHPEWNVAWGGEVMFSEDSLARENTAASTDDDARQKAAREAALGGGQHLDNRRENALLSRVGMGYFIYPKPNRLIVAAATAPYTMNLVKSAAGDRTHCTISGYFVAASAGG